MPKSTAVSTDTTSAKASTTGSSETSKSTGTGNTPVPNLEIARLAQYASNVPRAPPAIASTDALTKELPDDPRASRTDRRANRQFPPAYGIAREQHVGHVGAGNQEHEARRHEQHCAGRPHIAVYRRMKPDRCGRHDNWLHVLVLGRIFRAQTGKDRVHLPGGLLHGSLFTQPALEEQPSCSPLVETRFPRLVVRAPSHAGEFEGVDHRDRNPEVRDDARDGSTHAPRRDPDDGVAAAAQLKRLAQRAGLPAELTLPETVADHDHRGAAARALLVRGKTPAGRRRDAEHCRSNWR